MRVLALIETVLYLFWLKATVISGLIFPTTKVESFRTFKWRQSLTNVAIPHCTGKYYYASGSLLRSGQQNGDDAKASALESDGNFFGRDEERIINLGEDSLTSLEEDTSSVLKKVRGSVDTTFYPAVYDQSRLSVTKVWDLDMWTKHTSRMRYIRHILTIPISRLTRRIWPQVTFFILWSVVYSVFVPNAMARNFCIPLTTLSLVSTFVAFLLTLRCNQGLSRLAEGRELWGRAFIVTRDTSQLLATYAYHKDIKLSLLAARHLAVFPWLLKDQLRNTTDEEIVKTMIQPGTDRKYLLSQRKKPVAIIMRLRQIVAHLGSRKILPFPAHLQLERNLSEMNYIVGMCERLRGSPIPPAYTSHASRLLMFYLSSLPPALHGAHFVNALSSSTTFRPLLATIMRIPVTTIVITAVVSYAMLGLDEISHVLEQPFRLMPIREISQNIMLDAVDAFRCQPHDLKPGTVTESESSHVLEELNNPPIYW